MFSASLHLGQTVTSPRPVGRQLGVGEAGGLATDRPSLPQSLAQPGGGGTEHLAKLLAGVVGSFGWVKVVKTCCFGDDYVDVKPCVLGENTQESVGTRVLAQSFM